jgi:peptidoglycan/xylan/chitin deacetylase (PgdA/CDA1 family)
MTTTILYYHSIGPCDLSLPVDIFESHLNLIKKSKFQNITLNQLNSTHSENKNNKIILTFDDCFMSVFDYALPLLKKHNLKATFFAVPGYDKKTLWGSKKLGRWSEEKKDDYTIPYTFMGEAERKKLLNLGMEIGAHTMTHPNLDTLTSENAYKEMIYSKQFLEAELNYPITSFCYPRGRLNTDVIKQVEKCKFTIACTTVPNYVKENDSPFKLSRFTGSENLRDMKDIINGNWFSLPHRAKRKLFKLL